MLRNRLGKSDITVSRVCLGTMTWGEQNDRAEAFAQLDRALELGVDFIDTAELYPVPGRSATYAQTETIIGEWIAARPGVRQKIIIATKISGTGAWVRYIRDGKNGFDGANLVAAVDGSLKRLNCDHIDLYQLHWPERATNFFGRLGFAPGADAGLPRPFADTIHELDGLIRAGKIRHWGISNETAWGAMAWLREAEKLGLPQPITIQNPYSLINRSFEVGLAEVAFRENLGLLAYSPLGFGVLTGKYLDDSAAPNARLRLFGSHFTRYTKPVTNTAVAKYVALAKSAGLTPVQLALGYVNSRPFLSATIIGGTSVNQIVEDIAACDTALTPDLLKKVDEVHAEIPNPAP